MKFIKNNYHYFYLILSLVGGTFTFYYALLGILEHNGAFDGVEFIKSTWIENNYAKSITLDFWTGTIAGTFFILAEGIRLKIKKLWTYLLLTFFIGFAFGFPLFLFVRHRQLLKTDLDLSSKKL
jgi:hypothetical protein